MRRRLYLRQTIICIIALCLCAVYALAQDDAPVLSEGFEGAIPDLHTYQASYAGDDTQAHTGVSSLRVTPEGRGGAYFRLDGVIDRTSDCEFSAWVNAGADGAVELYISASDGERRHTVAQVSGGRAGEWVKLAGGVRAEDWAEADSDVMLAMVCSAESHFDDVAIVRTVLPDPPIEAYPAVEQALRAQADTRARTIEQPKTFRLDATDGALAPNLAISEVTLPDSAEVEIPSDGLLTFALDVAEATYVTGRLTLRSDADLRPGLRAYVLSDSTLIAAPMIDAADWGPLATRDSIPDIEGPVRPGRIDLPEWLLPAGRHYLTVAGPFFRPAGTFVELQIEPLPREVEEPQLTFALFSDTHIAKGRWQYRNVIMGEPSAEALKEEFPALEAQGVDFALMAGDMVNAAAREQFEMLADVLSTTSLPVYGCVGNHDAYNSSSRGDMLELVPGLFPEGETNYTFRRGPLRFIVLDASYWRTKDGQITDQFDRDNWSGIGLAEGSLQWLRDSLAEDTQTPTIVVWHYGFYDRRGATCCGYEMSSSTCVSSDEVLTALREAPNLVATLSGHSHWNQVNTVDGIAHIQNAAFAEWPNCYRVFRVYDDRVEWETRQVANRGMVREAFTPEKAQSWMISTGPGDLVGRFELTR